MRKYITAILIILFMGITVFVENADSATSRKRQASTRSKKSSNTKRAASTSRNNRGNSKRAATTNRGNSKRAATTGRGNSKRAATTGRGNTKRAATTSSANKRNRMFSRGSIASTQTAVRQTTATTSKTGKVNWCPVGKVLSRKANGTNSDGAETYVYYYQKNKSCTPQEDDLVEALLWEKAKVSSYASDMSVLPSWIKANDAYYFKCKTGYVPAEVNNIKICVGVSEICPLNAIVERNSNKEFVHPNTQETCIAPAYSTSRNVTGDENTRSWDVADDDAFIFECLENGYAEPLASNPSISIECKQCASGLYSAAGSKGVASCKLPCPTNQIFVLENGEAKCSPCDSVAKYDYETKTCSCPSGYEDTSNGKGLKCKKLTTASDCDTNATFKADTRECVCNANYSGSGFICTLNCATNAELVNGSCVCKSGFTGDGVNSCTQVTNLSASDCDENATFSGGACVCNDGYFGDGIKANGSPYCTANQTVAQCQNTANSETPRGCHASCGAGYAWQAN